MATAFPFLVVIQLAIGLHRGNQDLLTANDAHWWGLITGLVLAWLGAIVAVQLGKPLRRYLWGAIAGYAFFLLIREIAFPPKLGTLDGGNLFEAVTSRYQFLELAALAAFILAATLTPLRISMRIASLLSVAFLAGLLLNGSQVLWHSTASGGVAEGNSPRLSATAQEAKPDVFHIMYDTYQTVEHQFTVSNSGGAAAPYEDFVFFPKNIANYNFTELVIPATFSGTLYAPDQELADWKKESLRGGLLKSLKDSGYHIQGHSYHSFYFTSPLSDFERHTVDVIADAESNAGVAQRADFLRSSFFELMVLRCLPTVASKAVLSRRDANLAANADLPPRTASAYYCTQKFREVLDQLKSTPPGNHYYFVHLILPHSPFVLDSDGNYLGGDHGTHYQQSRFADKLTAELIAELKRLGRYDNSMIMIQADTGEYFVPDVNQQHLENNDLISYVTPRWKNGEMLYADEVDGHQSSIWPVDDRRDARLCPEPIVKARSQALLLIKPPHHRGYEIHPQPSQSVDVAPTILGAVGIEYDPAQFSAGVDLFKEPVTVNRVRKTYVLGALRAGERTGGLQEWQVVEDRFTKLKPWTVKDSDDVYRFR